MAEYIRHFHIDPDSNEEVTQSYQLLLDDGITYKSIPYWPGNSDYDKILVEVEAGTSTIVSVDRTSLQPS
jgi:hypothetical protein